jgi:hypothetical protein
MSRNVALAFDDMVYAFVTVAINRRRRTVVTAAPPSRHRICFHDVEPRDATGIVRGRQGGYTKCHVSKRHHDTACGAGARTTTGQQQRLCFRFREGCFVSDRVHALSVTSTCIDRWIELAGTIFARTKRGKWVGLLAAVVSAACATPGWGQVTSPVPPEYPARPPWNALDVLEPMPFASIWELSERDQIAPEDKLVRLRQHPGYEAVGVRAGSWMFHPSMRLGTLYDSNVFSSSTDKQSDVALVVAPTLQARTLWERHEVDLQASARAYFYRQNSGLDQTNANLVARGRIDIAHDRAFLTRVEIARRNIDVGTLTSPAGAVEPTPYNFFSGSVAYRQEFNRLTASVGGRVNS